MGDEPLFTDPVTFTRCKTCGARWRDDLGSLCECDDPDDEDWTDD